MASLAPGPPAQADPSRGKHLCQSPEGENPGERGAEGDATFSPGTQLPKVTPKGRGCDVDSQAPRSSRPHLQPERAQGRTHQETRGYGSPGKDQLVQPLGRERGGGWCWRRKGRSVPHRTCGPGAPPCLLWFRENAPGFGNLGMCLKPEVETSQEVEVSVGVSLPRTGWGELREGERGGQGDFPSKRQAGGSGHPCNTRSSTVSGGPPGAASGPEHTIWGPAAPSHLAACPLFLQGDHRGPGTAEPLPAAVRHGNIHSFLEACMPLGRPPGSTSASGHTNTSTHCPSAALGPDVLVAR